MVITFLEPYFAEMVQQNCTSLLFNIFVVLGSTFCQAMVQHFTSSWRSLGATNFEGMFHHLMVATFSEPCFGELLK